MKNKKTKFKEWTKLTLIECDKEKVIEDHTNIIVTLFNPNGPSYNITVIKQKFCPESLLKMCNVPDKARIFVKNLTKAELINHEPIFVRGVNSSFYQIKIDEEKYYVNERLVRRNYEQ